MDIRLTYDSNGSDITCMKEYDALKYPCLSCDRKDCGERKQRMELSDIKINKTFANTVPSEEKMEKCRQHWNKYNTQDRYITVNHKNVLIDGYVQYLILKEQGINEAEVKVSSYSTYKYYNQMTTYIFGVHPNSKNDKERVWRVPHSWTEWENGLVPGDRIMVFTKHGIAPIIITRIERLDKCPIDLPVRKVYRKCVKK